MRYVPALEPRFRAAAGAVWDHGGHAARPLSPARARSLCAFFRAQSLRLAAESPPAAQHLRDRFLELHKAITLLQL